MLFVVVFNYTSEFQSWIEIFPYAVRSCPDSKFSFLDSLLSWPVAPISLSLKYLAPALCPSVGHQCYLLSTMVEAIVIIHILFIDKQTCHQRASSFFVFFFPFFLCVLHHVTSWFCFFFPHKLHTKHTGMVLCKRLHSWKTPPFILTTNGFNYHLKRRTQ